MVFVGSSADGQAPIARIVNAKIEWRSTRSASRTKDKQAQQQSKLTTFNRLPSNSEPARGNGSPLAQGMTRAKRRFYDDEHDLLRRWNEVAAGCYPNTCFLDGGNVVTSLL